MAKSMAPSILLLLGLLAGASLPAFAACPGESNIFGGAASVAAWFPTLLTGPKGSPGYIYGSYMCYIGEGSGAGRAGPLNGNLLAGSSDVALNSLEEQTARRISGIEGGTRTGVLQLPWLLLYYGIATSDAIPGRKVNGEAWPLTQNGVALGYKAGSYSWGTPIYAPDLARLFAGKIATWDKVRVGLTKIVSARWPSEPVKIAYRSESSSSTTVFTTYMNTAAVYSAAWQEAIPSTTARVFSTWPSAVLTTSAAPGLFVPQEGTTNLYKYLASTSSWAMSYLQCGYARGMVAAAGTKALKQIAIRTPAGTTVTCKTCTALQALPRAPPPRNASWSLLSFVNTAGKYTCPIVALNFIIVREDFTVGPTPVAASRLNMLKNFLLYVNRVSSTARLAPFGVGAVTAEFKSVNAAAIARIKVN